MQPYTLRSAALLLVASLVFSACDSGDPDSNDNNGVNSFNGVWAESDPDGDPDYLSVESGRMKYYDQFEGNECYFIVGEANATEVGSDSYKWSFVGGIFMIEGTVGSNTLTLTFANDPTTGEFVKTNRDVGSIDVCLD